MDKAPLQKFVTPAQGSAVFPLRVASMGIINYSYLIVDSVSGSAAIVDPAWELETILRKLTELKADLTTIFLTHCHTDHVNLVAPLVKRFDAKVVISRREKEYYGFSSPNLFPVGHLDEVALGSTVITCVLTPGHTAGGMCYMLVDSIFTGDTVFIEGCGICTTDGGSPVEMFESMEFLKKILPPHFLVYPGHSYGHPPGRRFDFVQRQNIYFQLDCRETFINFRMRSGQRNLFSFR